MSSISRYKIPYHLRIEQTERIILHTNSNRLYSNGYNNYIKIVTRNANIGSACGRCIWFQYSEIRISA